MVTITQDGSTLVIALTGRLDHQTCHACETEIIQRVKPGISVMILDLRNLTYVASLGLRLILLLAKRVKQSGGRLVVCGLQPHVREVFEVSGFLSLFPICDTPEQALTSATSN